MSVTVTCYGGGNEIGGNKILIEDGEKRLMLDFGMSFGRTGTYFDGVFLTKRAGRGLLDPLSLGLIPPLRGVLRDDLVPAMLGDRDIEAFWQHWQNRFPESYRDLRRNGPAVDAVLISHCHQDHIADLEYLSGDIPVASTCTTAFIGKVLADVGGGSGAVSVRPAALTHRGILHSDRVAGSLRRPWCFLDRLPDGTNTSDPLATARSFWESPGTKNSCPVPSIDHAFEGSVGPWQIRWWPVDHSIPGAAAFAIETEVGWVGYSGDIRFHGRQGSLTWRATAEMAALNPVALLCEGTRLTEPNATTEVEVYENCLCAVQEAAGQLVVADFAPRNTERFEIFARIARKTGRRLLVQPKDAYLLRALHLADPNAPDLMAVPHVGIYDDPKCLYRKYESAVRNRYADCIVSPAEVCRHRGDYILAFSLTDLADLLDMEYLLKDSLDGIYIFSNSPAFDDEQQMDLVRLWNWTQHLELMLVGLTPRRDGAGKLVAMDVQPGFHASGHAGRDELQEFVCRVAPKSLIPIHTDAAHLWPDMLNSKSIDIISPHDVISIGARW